MIPPPLTTTLPMNDEPLPCWVFRSNRKVDTYLYLSREDSFDELPEPLRRLFGAPTLVMRLDLTPERRLAQEDVLQVMENLRARGFHLQLPPFVDAVRPDA